MKYKPVFFDIETTGFNPLAQKFWGDTDYGGRVTAVGMGTVSDDWRQRESCSVDVDVYWDGSEYRLLDTLDDRVEELIGDITDGGNDDVGVFLVTFNGRQFDHPYLGARYARLRLDGGWFNHKLKRLDMMRVFGKHYDGVGRYPSEDDCLEACGIPSHDEYDGSDMPDAYADRDWDMIEEHVRHDVNEMIKLFVDNPEICMKEFYNHYDVDKDPSFAETVDL